MNDLPVARVYPEHSKIPALRVGKLNNGIPVETYAEAFFQDPENSALGIIILQALSGPDGDNWQYSVDDGKTFNDVRFQNNLFHVLSRFHFSLTCRLVLCKVGKSSPV